MSRGIPLWLPNPSRASIPQTPRRHVWHTPRWRPFGPEAARPERLCPNSLGSRLVLCQGEVAGFYPPAGSEPAGGLPVLTPHSHQIDVLGSLRTEGRGIAPTIARQLTPESAVALTYLRNWSLGPVSNECSHTFVSIQPDLPATALASQSSSSYNCRSR